MSLSERASLADQIRQKVIDRDVRELNALICKAISLATGVIDPNPYDFINRMSSQDAADWVIIRLDGTPILKLGPSTSVVEDGMVNVQFPYTMLVEQQTHES